MAWSDFFGRFPGRLSGPLTVSDAIPLPIPTITPSDYRVRLRNAVALPGFVSIDDDPSTPENERRTFCNLFVRTVVRWFGFTGWRPPEVDGERAADILAWMAANPARWRSLDGPGRYVAARDYAVAGRLIVVSSLYPAPAVSSAPGGWSASGHVAIIAPEPEMWKSGTYGADVPLCANVGGRNFYGEGISKAFKTPPTGMFLFIG